MRSDLLASIPKEDKESFIEAFERNKTFRDEIANFLEGRISTKVGRIFAMEEASSEASFIVRQAKLVGYCNGLNEVIRMLRG